MRKFFLFLLRIFTVTSVVLLILSWISPIVSPRFFWLMGLFGVAYPVFLVMVVISIILWLFFEAKVSMYLALLIILVYGPLRHSFSFRISTKAVIEDSETFSILSYNVNLLGLYGEKPEVKDSIIAYIQEKKFNIVCFQEFYSDTITKINEKLFLENTSVKYIYSRFFAVRNKRHGFGMTIMSDLPMISSGVVDSFPRHKNSGNGAIFADIVKGNDTIRVLNIHLESLKLNHEREIFESNDMEKSEIEKESRSLLRKYKNAAKRRSDQVNKLVQFVKISPYPVFLCGDFNDPPVSFTYKSLRENMKDAFLDASTGIGFTYEHHFVPLRIDYIFYPRTGYDCGGFQIGKKNFSDHYPISCSFRKIK